MTPATREAIQTTAAAIMGLLQALAAEPEPVPVQPESPLMSVDEALAVMVGWTRRRLIDATRGHVCRRPGRIPMFHRIQFMEFAQGRLTKRFPRGVARTA